MFQLSRGGLEVPMTTQPEFSPTPFPDITMPMYTPDKPTDFTNAVKSVAPINMNTIKGVSGKVYTSDKQLPLPPISSGSTSVARPTLNTAVRAANLPSYIPSDTPKGLISRDNWENYDDVNFYVGTDGKYYSTDPYFNRVIFRESSHVLNPNPTSGHRGPTQFDKSTWERVMPNVPYAYAADPKYAGQAAVALAKANAASLKKSNLPVNAVTVYGAHNLGLGGISKILKNPDNPLSDVVINNMKDWKKFKKVPQELRDKISTHPESLIGRDYLDYLSYIFSND